MIKAQELRVGNLINFYHHKHDLTEIKIQGIYFDEELKEYCVSNEYYPVNINGLVPIPLTEEWLLKFNAECYEFDNGQPNQYRIGSRLFVIRDKNIVDYGSSVVIKYVHQLQNLYFALTGEELELK
jgi:hypothetical protein